MTDREMVIGHLNDCMEASRRDNTWVFVRKDIVEDAIVLLKEQEDMGKELTDAMELVRRKNERIEKLLKEQKAVESKTGHWIFESAYCDVWTHTCSECGKRVTTAYNTYANCCRYCGAKMEGR